MTYDWVDQGYVTTYDLARKNVLDYCDTEKQQQKMD